MEREHTPAPTGARIQEGDKCVKKRLEGGASKMNDQGKMLSDAT